MLQHLVRPFTLALVTGAAALALVAANPVPASASAWGCAWGNPAFGPTQYCVTLSGSGNWVSSVTGNYNGSATVGSWYITAEFFDLSWHWYQTLQSRVHGGYQNAGGDVIPVNAWKYTGYMCSTLHYALPIFGWRVMSVCHRVG
jgi:hypothetical protein